MAYKIPISVLVVVHTPALEVLLLERADRPGFWQSVTGSQDEGETLRETAVRELKEETGLDAARYELDRLAQAEPLRDLPPLAQPLRAGRHAQHRARVRPAGAGAAARSRSSRGSICATSGCRGARQRRRYFRGATPRRYANCRSACTRECRTKTLTRMRTLRTFAALMRRISCHMMMNCGACRDEARTGNGS